KLPESTRFCSHISDLTCENGISVGSGCSLWKTSGTSRFFGPLRAHSRAYHTDPQVQLSFLPGSSILVGEGAGLTTAHRGLQVQHRLVSAPITGTVTGWAVGTFRAVLAQLRELFVEFIPHPVHVLPQHQISAPGRGFLSLGGTLEVLRTLLFRHLLHPGSELTDAFGNCLSVGTHERPVVAFPLGLQLRASVIAQLTNVGDVRRTHELRRCFHLVGDRGQEQTQGLQRAHRAHQDDGALRVLRGVAPYRRLAPVGGSYIGQSPYSCLAVSAHTRNRVVHPADR